MEDPPYKWVIISPPNSGSEALSDGDTATNVLTEANVLLSNSLSDISLGQEKLVIVPEIATFFTRYNQDGVSARIEEYENWRTAPNAILTNHAVSDVVATIPPLYAAIYPLRARQNNIVIKVLGRAIARTEIPRSWVLYKHGEHLPEHAIIVTNDATVKGRYELVIATSDYAATHRGSYDVISDLSIGLALWKLPKDTIPPETSDRHLRRYFLTDFRDGNFEEKVTFYAIFAFLSAFLTLPLWTFPLASIGLVTAIYRYYSYQRGTDFLENPEYIKFDVPYITGLLVMLLHQVRPTLKLRPTSQHFLKVLRFLQSVRNGNSMANPFGSVGTLGPLDFTDIGQAVAGFYRSRQRTTIPINPIEVLKLTFIPAYKQRILFDISQGDEYTQAHILALILWGSHEPEGGG